jgi:serine/threonine protein kinase
MRPKLADFGTVRQEEMVDDNTHLKTETVVGTRCYMPPGMHVLELNSIPIKPTIPSFSIQSM